MARVQVKMVKVDASAILPSYATDGDAGMDLYSHFYGEIGRTIPSGDRTVIGTGFRMELPPGYEAQIRPRSGLALKYGITVLNAPGTIDSGFRGEVGVIIINHGKSDYCVKDGERIAQMVIKPVEQAEIVEVEEISDTIRGNGGFGSTGL